MKLISTLFAAAAVSSVFVGPAIFKDRFLPTAKGALDENGYIDVPKADDKSAFATCYREELGIKESDDIKRTRNIVDHIFGDAASNDYRIEYDSFSVPAQEFQATHDYITGQCLSFRI